LKLKETEGDWGKEKKGIHVMPKIYLKDFLQKRVSEWNHCGGKISYDEREERSPSSPEVKNIRGQVYGLCSRWE